MGTCTHICGYSVGIYALSEVNVCVNGSRTVVLSCDKIGFFPTRLSCIQEIASTVAVPGKRDRKVI